MRKELNTLITILCLVFLLCFLTSGIYAGNDDTIDRVSVPEESIPKEDLPEDDGNTGEEEIIPDEEETPAPMIHTVVSAWDVFRLGEEELSLGSEGRPAEVLRYTAYEVDEEKQAEIEKQIKEAEEKAEKQAEKDALKLAEELINNGRYKYVISEDDRYQKHNYDYYDEDDEEFDEDESEDFIDEEHDYDEDSDFLDSNSDNEYELADDDVKYFSNLAEQYPHIYEFWFDENGRYYYDYDVDYEGIDYDSMYYEVLHDTFHITDNVQYENFDKSRAYTVKAQLVLTETNENGELSQKEVIKELTSELTTDENGKGDIKLDFGDLQLDYGRYVVIMQVLDSEGQVYAGADNLNDNYETVEVLNHTNIAFDANASNKLPSNNKGEGFIGFPDVKSAVNRKSPQTGDYSLEEIAILLVMFLVSVSSILLLKKR